MNARKEAEKFIEEQQALFIRLYRNSIAIVDKEFDNRNKKKAKIENGNKVAVNGDWKFYFSLLFKNNILDMISKESYSDYHLMSTEEKSVIKSKYPYFAVYPSQHLIMKLEELFKRKQIRVRKDISQLLEAIINLQVENREERLQKTVTQIILNNHLYKRYLFTEENIKGYTGQDFVTKFWGPIFEEYLSHQPLFLTWVDMTTKIGSKTEINGDLKLNVLCYPPSQAKRSNEYGVKDINILERAKIVLGLKSCLNALIAQGYSPNAIVIPMVQIIDFTCQVVTLRCVDRSVYLFEKCMEFTYPTSYTDLQEGSIETMINVLGTLKTLCTNINSGHASSDNCNWTTPVFW